MAAVVNQEECIGCGKCEDVCPVEAIKVVEGKATVSDECIDCGACVDECPVEAINLLGNCEMKKIWSSENSVVRARQNS